MDAYKKEHQLLPDVEQENREQAFWCEPVSLANKEVLPPTSDPPCNADDDCSACNGNPNCSHGCA